VFIYFLYRLLASVSFPLIVLYLFGRGLRDRRYWQGLGERFGAAPPSLDATIPGGVWLHAVSVGEVNSSIEPLRRLRERYPGRPLYVSVTTVAGRQLADEKLKDLADAVFYAPLDLVWVLRRVLRRLRPHLVAVLETEIWPNLYRETKRFGCGLIVLNGRISDRAFPRYRRFRWFFARVLKWPDLILAQNRIAAERYAEIGAPSGRVRAEGNLKYDFQVRNLERPPVVDQFLKSANPDLVWIAASTMPPAEAGDPDEDAAAIEAFIELSRTFKSMLLILVPRRPERFGPAAQKLAAAGVPFLRRSELSGNDSPTLPGVLLLDSVGEMASLFPWADVVFMGGTLARRGGHNILEPALYGKAVVIGPHMENFPDIAEEFLSAGGVCRIRGPSELAPAVSGLFHDPARRQDLGNRARSLAESKRGASAAAVEAIAFVDGQALPVWSRSLPARLMLEPLSYVYRALLVLDRARTRARRGNLRAPVISAGNIAMGGTGKTPFVAFLADRIRGWGMSPAILTRGYRRSVPERNTILAPGERCSVARSGDEAQILLRTCQAWVGIGSERLETGRLMEEKTRPDVILLDDGFQHWRLDRDADIVLIDALDPFRGGAVFPAGRLREPLTALKRASAFLVTRSAFRAPWPALEKRLRQINPTAPIFYCRMEPRKWIDIEGKETHPATALPFRQAAAFCGLGSPASFWTTIASLPFTVRFRWTFADHETYRPQQLRHLASQARAAGADVLLTTEKDLMNLPDGAAGYIKPLRLFWLETSLTVHEEASFLEWLRPFTRPKTPRQELPLRKL
jgi:tetraacyldisaccharide 4'-kinase